MKLLFRKILNKVIGKSEENTPDNVNQISQQTEESSHFTTIRDGKEINIILEQLESDEALNHLDISEISQENPTIEAINATSIATSLTNDDNPYKDDVADLNIILDKLENSEEMEVVESFFLPTILADEADEADEADDLEDSFNKSSFIDDELNQLFLNGNDFLGSDLLEQGLYEDDFLDESEDDVEDDDQYTIELEISAEDRIEQLVVQFVDKIGCGEAFEPVLEKIFWGLDNQYTLSKEYKVRRSPHQESALTKLIVDNRVTPEELDLMFSIKMIWNDNHQLWSSLAISRKTRGISYLDQNYKQISWEFAYNFMQAFPFLSDEILIEDFLLSIYSYWYQENIRKKSQYLNGNPSYRVFHHFLQVLMEIGLNYGADSYATILWYWEQINIRDLEDQNLFIYKDKERDKAIKITLRNELNDGA